MKLIQLLILILTCPGIVYSFTVESPKSRIYSADEINAAQGNAVQTARNGNIEAALLQLQTLLKYSPKNQSLWIDYLTVLHWSQQDNLALSLLKNITLSQAPEYFLSAMFNAAQNKQSWAKLINISQHNMLIKNQADLEPKYWQAFDELYKIKQMPYAEKLIEQIAQSPQLSSNDLYQLIKRYQLLSAQKVVASLKNDLKKHADGNEKLHLLWKEEQEYLHANQQTEKAVSNIKQRIKSVPSDTDSRKKLISIQQDIVLQSLAKNNWRRALIEQEELIRLETTTYQFKQWADINRKIKPVEKQLDNYKDLLWKHPNEQWLIADTIAALSQHGDYEQAIKLLPRLNAKEAPSYALEHAAYSARKMQITRQALALYITGTQRFPNNIQFHLGKALCLIDQQKNIQANKVLSALESEHSGDIGVHQALALNYAERGMKTQELLQHQKILVREPSSASAYRKVAMLTLDLGSTEKAFELATQKPSLFSKLDWKRLYADRAAIAIRWANLHESSPDKYSSRLITAKQHLDEYQTFLNNNYPSDKKAIFHSQNDHLLLLSLMREYRRVVEIYKDMQASKIAVPADSHRIAASAYLALKQPRRSLSILNTLVDNNAVLGQKYYAHLDANEPEKALETVQRQRNINPIWLAHDESKFLDGNANRVAADTNEKLLPAYTNRLDESQKQLQSFLNHGPANTELRNHLATVYRWRGWPRKALAELELIEAIEPNYLSMRVNKVYNNMDIYHYHGIDEEIESLEQKHYLSAPVKSLKTAWQLEKMPSLEISASVAQASGSRFSSRDKTIQSRLNSALLNHHVRLYARALYSTNNQTLSGSFKRMGLGAQWRSKNLQLSSEITQGFDGENMGLGLSGSWFKDDHWTLSTELQSYSDQTPLRAFEQGVKLSRYAFNINHALHESRSSNLNFSLGDFSDGNLRKAVSLSHRFALKRSAKHLVDARLGLGWQANDPVNANYFNPSTFTNLFGGLDYTGTLHQHYDEHFRHRASLDLGLQNQSGFGQGITSALSYSHLWQLNKRLNGSYGVSFSTPIFDGARETSISYFAQLQWKF